MEEASMTTMRAVGYVRVSTEEQRREGYSLGEQRELIERHAAGQGWALGKVYEDGGWSGRRSDRPAYRELLDAAAAGEMDVLVVWRLDRLGRDLRERVTAEAALAEAGVRIVSLTDAEIDEADPAAPLYRAVRAGMAEMESRLIGQRVKIGQRAAAAQGIYPGGRRPYGYDVVGKEKERRLVVRAEEAAVVRRIFREYVGGTAGQGRITADLNADGIPSPSGKRWDRSQVKYILQNPTYRGQVRLGSERYEGRHEAIIDPSEWERARELLTTRSVASAATRGRPPLAPFLLTGGLLRCGCCGSRMNTRSYRDRNRQVYQCSQRAQTGGYRTCSMPEVKREQVDGKLLQFFETEMLDVDATREAIRSSHDHHTSETRAQLEQAETAESRAVAARERTVRAWTDDLEGKLKVERYNELLDRCDADLAGARAEADRLRDRLGEIEQERQLIDVNDELLRRLADLRAAVAGRIESATDVEGLRAVLRDVFEGIVLWVDPASGALHLLPALRKHLLPAHPWDLRVAPHVALPTPAGINGGIPSRFPLRSMVALTPRRV
jgi:DNA invertase Pin-like site-specific DNA recombinase